jgi:hypothetical protein
VCDASEAIEADGLAVDALTDVAADHGQRVGTDGGDDVSVRAR